MLIIEAMTFIITRVMTDIFYIITYPGMFNPHNAEIFLYKPWRPKGYFNLKSP